MSWWGKLFSRWRHRTDRTVPALKLVLVWLGLGTAVFVLGIWSSRGLANAFLISIGIISVAVMVIDWLALRRLGVPMVTRGLEYAPQIGVSCHVTYRVELPRRPASMEARALTRRLFQTMHIDGGLPSQFAFVEPVGRAAEAEDGSLQFSEVVRPRLRGSMVLRDVDATWRSPWGLWNRLHRYPQEQAITIYPDVTTWQKRLFTVQAALGHEGRHVQRLASGDTEFSHIAEHGPDDDPRRVNWAASARRWKLMKNAYEPERGQQLILGIDASRYMGVVLPDGKTRLDYAVECAAALAQAARSAGDKVGLVAFSDQVSHVIAPGQGPADERSLMQTLATLEAKPVQGGYQALLRSFSGRFHRRGLLVILSELEGVSTDTEFLPALQWLQRRHPTLFVSVEDVFALRESRQIPRSQAGAISVATAAWTLQRREDVVRRLRGGGVTVIESPPGDLVVHAVREYLERRQKFTL